MSPSDPPSRGSLSRDHIIDGAMALADEIGLEPLTIRRLADHLGVRPMTIYHYVKNKDDIVDGMVGRVFDEVERPAADTLWKDAIASDPALKLGLNICEGKVTYEAVAIAHGLDYSPIG